MEEKKTMTSDIVQTDENGSRESLPEARTAPVSPYNPVTKELVIDVFFYQNEDLGRPCIGREISIRNYDGAGNETDCCFLLERSAGFMEFVQDCTDEEYEEALKVSKEEESYILKDAAQELRHIIASPEIGKMNFRIEYHDDRNASS